MNPVTRKAQESKCSEYPPLSTESEKITDAESVNRQDCVRSVNKKGVHALSVFVNL